MVCLRVLIFALPTLICVEGRLGSPASQENETVDMAAQALPAGAVSNTTFTENSAAALGASSGTGGKRWFAEIAKAANCRAGAPLANVQHFDGGASAALVGEAGSTCVVAFAGTVNWGQAFQDLKSLHMVPLPGCSGCLVGSGFLQGYDSVKGQVKNALHARGCRDVAVTGHSLGGAEALIAMVDLSRDGYHLVDTYIFGNPLVGNGAFLGARAQAMPGAQLFRVVHGDDPIPKFGPPGASHAGTEIHENGHNVLTDHLYYAGIDMAPCKKDKIAEAIQQVVTGQVGATIIQQFLR